jgi:hypothetical protein
MHWRFGVDTTARIRYPLTIFCTDYRKPVKFGRGRATVIGYEFLRCHFPKGREGWNEVKPEARRRIRGKLTTLLRVRGVKDC